MITIRQSKNQICDFDIVKSIDILKEAKIVLYGTGKRGRKLKNILHLAGIKVVGFCDSDNKKRGHYIDDIIIYDLDDLSVITDKKIIVVVASVYFQEIIQNINDRNINVKICTYFACELSIFMHYKNKTSQEFLGINEYIEGVIDAEIINCYTIYKSNFLECLLGVINQTSLVFSPGKVGSSTLTNSLEYAGVKTSHCHRLFDEPMLKPFNPIFKNDSRMIEWRDKTLKNYHGKIIVLVREPISRDISQYFQWLVARRANIFSKDIFAVNDIFEGFYKIFCYPVMKHDIIYENEYLNAWNAKIKYGRQFDFFDLELKSLMRGTNIFDYPFDAEKGYSIYSINGIELMIIQLEKVNYLEKEIGKFFNIDNFTLHNSNISEGKEYKYLYKEFKRQIHLPQEYINFYYDNHEKFFHFYTDEQREKMRTKWDACNKIN